MKPTREDFLNQPTKAITLMGMSGVGKSYISCKLSEWGWKHFCCDYEIGTTYLGEEMVETLSAQRGEPVENTLSEEDLSLLSEFVGQLGSPDLYGLGLEEFKRRQKLYYDAECDSVLAAVDGINDVKDFMNIVIDSTGSLCEIEDESILDSIGKHSLFVYIKASGGQEQEVLKRAREYPKPLFFPEALFDQKLSDYLAEKGLGSSDEIEPNDFSRWVFPFLFEARLPKYQRLADQYGVTIPSEEFLKLESEEQFLSIIADHL